MAAHHYKTGPFGYQPIFYHLKSKHVQFTDPHCVLLSPQTMPSCLWWCHLCIVDHLNMGLFLLGLEMFGIQIILYLPDSSLFEYQMHGFGLRLICTFSLPFWSKIVQHLDSWVLYSNGRKAT